MPSNARFHAILSGYLSIVAGILETSFSLFDGYQEFSMSLFGIALMAFVDITGSVLVLIFWQCTNVTKLTEHRQAGDRIREMNYSLIIGYLMVSLGVFLLVASMRSLSLRDEPKDSNLGLPIALFGASSGLGLATYKYYVGKALDSPVVIADSVSSFCTGLVSCAALLVALVGHNVWWADSVTGFAAGLYTFYSGITTIYDSRMEKIKIKSAGMLHSKKPPQKHYYPYQYTNVGGDFDSNLSSIPKTPNNAALTIFEQFFFPAFLFSRRNEQYDRLPQDDEFDNTDGDFSS